MKKRSMALVWFLFLGFALAVSVHAEVLAVKDLAGRQVVLEKPPERIVCIAPGTLRLIVYLGAQEKLVGVEEIEKRYPKTRPYWIAHSELSALPSVGPGGPGTINNAPDLEALLSVNPDLVLISYLQKAKADALQAKLGIPVVVLSYGPFGRFDDTLLTSLRVAGTLLDREERAQEVIGYIEGAKADLLNRVQGVPEKEKPGVYIGGIGFKGTQGIGSTETSYAPFDWLRARNVAASLGTKEHLFLDRERLLLLDPEVIFLDGGGKSLVAVDMKKNPAFYQGLSAFRNGRVYTLHSYNWYMTNIGTAIADAYAAGKILYPGRFADVDIAEKADAIYTFLVGKPVHAKLAAVSGPMGEQLDL